MPCCRQNVNVPDAYLQEEYVKIRKSVSYKNRILYIMIYLSGVLTWWVQCLKNCWNWKHFRKYWFCSEKDCSIRTTMHYHHQVRHDDDAIADAVETLLEYYTKSTQRKSCTVGGRLFYRFIFDSLIFFLFDGWMQCCTHLYTNTNWTELYTIRWPLYDHRQLQMTGYHKNGAFSLVKCIRRV